MYDDRGLEEVGDIMSWGALVVSVQDCPDYPALLVDPVYAKTIRRWDAGGQLHCVRTGMCGVQIVWVGADD
ncbi:MAG: hypothetical protein DRO93_08320, partial [Candidatus Thorarchaeota archaeon]